MITGEENLNCAGRSPGPEERAAVLKAQAVFVPQGARQDLYQLCRSACPLVWPNLDARFEYPGKVGQALLLARLDLPRPKTVVFPSTRDFARRRGGALPRPFVLKSDLGGQGGGVWPVRTKAEETRALTYLAQAEKLGRGGFVQQEMIEHGGRDLRVAVIGQTVKAYWRIAPPEENFYTNLSAGGQADFDSDPDLMKQGVETALKLVRAANLDLAGIDVMFDARAAEPEPLLIEINWYFGRQALGGSEAFYRVLKKEAARWLKIQGLKRGPVRSRPQYSQKD